jgi:septal ring factor EnvC (AmiA/AmiB activator)
MNSPVRSLLLILAVLAPQALDAQQGEVGKIKELELEEVRARISELKTSMDKSAAQRDRLARELQTAEVAIAEKRMRLSELERERQYSLRQKADLEEKLAIRKQELEAEERQLAEQVRTAYISGSEEKVKLLLNQRDPAMLGRLMTYYGYFNEHRKRNIDTVRAHIHELAALHQQIAAEETRLTDLTSTRYAELTELNTAQEQRGRLLATLKAKIAAEGREVDRLAAVQSHE